MTRGAALPQDLRARLVAGAGALLLVAPIARPGPALAALAAVLLLYALERQPIAWRRLRHLEAFLMLLLATMPFTVPGAPVLRLGPFAASADGFERACVLAAKVSASVLLLALLFVATEPERLGAAMRALRFPERLTRIFLGLVRYLGLIRAEMDRLREAMRLRAFRPRASLHSWRSYGNLIGMVLLRALHRAERVEEAMRLRGYSGRFLHEAPPKLASGDLLAGFVLLAGAAGLLLWDLT